MANVNANGKVCRVDAEPDTPLLWVLRGQLGLTGGGAGKRWTPCGPSLR